MKCYAPTCLAFSLSETVPVQQGECGKRRHRYGRFSVKEGRRKKAFSVSKISVVQIRKICNKKLQRN